jgi:hypothetical protein
MNAHMHIVYFVQIRSTAAAVSSEIVETYRRIDPKLVGLLSLHISVACYLFRMLANSPAGELLFGQEAKMPKQLRTLNAVTSPAKPETDEKRLTASEARRLIGVCIELIDVCSKVSGRVNAEVGSILAYPRDEALAGIHEARS